MRASNPSHCFGCHTDPRLRPICQPLAPVTLVSPRPPASRWLPGAGAASPCSRPAAPPPAGSAACIRAFTISVPHHLSTPNSMVREGEGGPEGPSCNSKHGALLVSLTHPINQSTHSPTTRKLGPFPLLQQPARRSRVRYPIPYLDLAPQLRQLALSLHGAVPPILLACQRRPQRVAHRLGALVPALLQAPSVACAASSWAKGVCFLGRRVCFLGRQLPARQATLGHATGLQAPPRPA